MRKADDGGGADKKPKPASWSGTIEKTFLEALSESANVAQSAIGAGTTDKRAWQRRQSDAKFRAAFQRALAEGYLRLELRMLERALERVGGGKSESDPPTATQERIWLQQLRQHHASVQTSGIFDEIDDLAVVTERIDEKLAGMKRRLAERSTGGGEAGDGAIAGGAAGDVADSGAQADAETAGGCGARDRA